MVDGNGAASLFTGPGASALAAAALWALASVIYQRLGTEVGPLALNALKCVFAFGLMGATLFVLGGDVSLGRLEPRHWGWFAMSALLGLAIGDWAYFSALVRLGPARALIVGLLAPVVGAGLGRMVLGEPVTGAMALGMVTTIAGVAWVVAERDRVALPPRSGMAFALVAAACQGSSQVCSKLGAYAAPGAPISPLEVGIARLGVAAVVLLLALGTRRRLAELVRVATPVRRLARFALACVFGTYLGIWLSMDAVVRAASVGVASTLLATSPLFAMAWVVVLRGERPTARAVGGTLVAIAGVGILLARW